MRCLLICAIILTVKTSLAFMIFVVSMVGSLILNINMNVPLFIGFLLFSKFAYDQGYSFKDIGQMIKNSLGESLIVIRILLLIGCLTGLWRQNGTISYFLTLGVTSIPPSIFILASFLLTTIMSYALGTSFGVTATAGVILMSIARAGNVNTTLTAGAILSGVYIGDRGSPAASSGNLVAALTHTDMSKNVKTMLKDTMPAILVCIFLYGLLSIYSPMEKVDTTILNLLNDNYKLNYLCLIPALIMIVLPFAKINIRNSMIVSIIASILVSVLVQGNSLWTAIQAMLFGYSHENEALNAMLSGGGISSMLDVCLILLISGTYGQIFKSTGLLNGLNEQLKAVMHKTGRFPLMLLLSIAVCGIFCNQTIGVIMLNQLSMDLYGEDEREKRMLDMEDSVIVIAGLVPWCIACSVPLAMLGVTNAALPFAFYLYLVPLFHLFKKA